MTLRDESRLAGSPGLGCAELARLRRATAAAVGLGVIGGQVSYHLALLGVGLVAIDSGLVEPENLANQGLPATSRGAPKSLVRARQLSILNPECPIVPLAARIEDLGLGTLAGCDLLVTGLDSRRTRARVNEIAWRLGIPWVDAAVDGTGRWLRGTVTLYDPRRPDSPCYLCHYGPSDLAAMAREGQGPGCPSWRRSTATLTPPTLQASTFGSIVAGYQALWATRTLLDGTDALVGRQLAIVCDGEPRTELLALRRHPRCVFDHRRFEPLRAAPAETVGDLLALARTDLTADVETLVLHGRTLACGLLCPRCGARREVARVAERFSDDDVACSCSAEVEMAPAGLTSELSEPVARLHAGRSWKDLGVPPLEIVTARGGDREVHYIVNFNPLPLGGGSADPGQPWSDTDAIGRTP